MAELLHEYWEGEDGGEFGPVKQDSDAKRPILLRGARLVFSLRASSWHQDMQLYNDRLGYGIFYAAGVPDYFYTDKEAAEQDAYLVVRDVR